ncbi:MAG: GAF domain-containing protein [Dehalococcoidales bacterium]|nr:GAF domain-containing protein [Dehalococcoidales bacterium]
MISPLENAAYLIPPLVAAFITLILLLFACQKGFKEFSNRLFCGILISMMLHCLVTFFMRSSLDVEHAVFWDRFVPPTAWGIFAFYYHFSLVYTGNKKQRGILYAAYLVLLATVALIPTPLIIESMIKMDYGYTPVNGPLIYPLGIASLIMVAAGYNIITRYRISRSYEERNRLLYLFIALLFPMIGGMLDGFTDLPPMAIWANLIFGIICSVVIFRYHLLDIRIAVREGLVYLTISAIVAIPYVGVLYILNFLIEPATEKWWVHALIILIFAVLLRPIYSRAQEWVNRLFYRNTYTYIRALEEFTQEFQSIQDLDRIANSMIHLISGAMRANSICLLLPSEEQQGFVVVTQIGLNDSLSEIVLGNTSSFVRWMDTHGEAITSEQLDFIPRLQSISSRDRDSLERMKSELCVPLKTSKGLLSGIIVLGKKHSGKLYTDTERRMLTTLSGQMAMALENARLYDTERNLRVELEKQNAQKTEFLNQVAHEMKTPLTSLISSSELLEYKLEEQGNSDGILKRLIGNLRRSADNMDRRVTELLELARTQNSDIKLQLEPVIVYEAILEITSDLNAILSSRDQHLSLDVPESLPPVIADRGRLDQIVYNLLSNASKYSPDNSLINIRAYESENYVVIEVRDQAPHITDVEKTKIFEPYYRGEDEAEQYEVAGLGLGLYITKNLVELHKGEIWVDNTSPQGNIFAFSLPVL